MSRAPSSSNPPGLDKFTKELDQAIVSATANKSMTGVRLIVDQIEWVSSNSLSITAKRLASVMASVPKFDSDVKKAEKAIEAGTKIRLTQSAGRPPSAAYTAQQKIKSLRDELGWCVSQNILQLSESQKLFNEANYDISIIQEKKKEISDVTSLSSSLTKLGPSVVVRNAAIAIYWKKHAVESSCITINSILDSVEKRLLRIPEIINEIYVEENVVNGSSSVLSTSVNAAISAQVENDKKAQKAVKDKALFDTYMQFANQSPLGGYIAKVLNSLFSIGEMRDPPSKYEIVPAGRAGLSSEIQQFYNDLTFNLLNDYKTLTDRQLAYLSALSGGQTSIQELKEARANEWKKEIEPQDLEPVSSSYAANPFAKSSVPRSRQKSEIIVSSAKQEPKSEYELERRARISALATVEQTKESETKYTKTDDELNAKIAEQNRAIELERARIEEAIKASEADAAKALYDKQLADAANLKSEAEKKDALEKAEAAGAELSKAYEKLAEAERESERKTAEAEKARVEAIEASKASAEESLRQMKELESKIAELEKSSKSSDESEITLLKQQLSDMSEKLDSRNKQDKVAEPKVGFSSTEKAVMFGAAGLVVAALLIKGSK